MSEPAQKKTAKNKVPIMHALGQSVGILWKAIRQPVHPPKKQADETPPQRRVIEEDVKQIQQGNVTLRETRIREVEISPPSDADDDEARQKNDDPSGNSKADDS